MKVEDIREPNQYHYQRKRRRVLCKGVIHVAQIYQGKGRSGTYIVGLDPKLGKNVTLRPREVMRPVRIRQRPPIDTQAGE